MAFYKKLISFILQLPTKVIRFLAVYSLSLSLSLEQIVKIEVVTITTKYTHRSLMAGLLLTVTRW